MIQDKDFESTLFSFTTEVCDYCGEPDPSGFKCCQDCSDKLADELDDDDWVTT